MNKIVIPLYKTQLWVVILSYLFFFVFIIDGLLTFDYSSVTYYEYPTFSEILATRIESTLLYGIIISLYGISKMFMLVFYISTRRPYWIPIVLFSIIHIVGFFVIGMADITSMPDPHIWVARITFTTAVFRSTFMFMSRLSPYSEFEPHDLRINFGYIIILVTLLIMLGFEVVGYVEWVFIVFILTENALQVLDYGNHKIVVYIDDESPVYPIDVDNFEKIKADSLIRNVHKIHTASPDQSFDQSSDQSDRSDQFDQSRLFLPIGR